MVRIENYLREQKISINETVKKYIDSNSERKVIEAAKYIASFPANRYRCILGLEIYKGLGGEQTKFLKGVCGIEYTHIASIIFDDLPGIDNASVRRGKPTIHVKFGEDTAILTGLYFWGVGRELLSEVIHEHLSNSKDILDVESYVYESMRELIRGQELDLKKNKSDDELFDSIQQKNKLFQLSCELPGFLLSVDEELTSILRGLGKEVSMAYQLFDDLRDIEGDPEITGKLIGIDKDKNTSVYRFGPDEVKKEITNLKENIIEKSQKIQSTSNLELIIDHMLNKPS